MIAIAEWSSSTSEMRFPPAVTADRQVTVSVIESDHQYSLRWSRFGDGIETMGDRIVENTTSYGAEDTEFFDFGISGAVFASDGLARTKSQAYSARVKKLRDFASQDGVSLNPASEFDFWRFLEMKPHWRKGNLVLIDNGNLRAVWKNGKGTYLGLQFLGDGMLQFVISKQREATQPVSRVAGRDTFEGLRQQIDVFELASLFYE